MLKVNEGKKSLQPNANFVDPLRGCYCSTGSSTARDTCNCQCDGGSSNYNANYNTGRNL